MRFKKYIRLFIPIVFSFTITACANMLFMNVPNTLTSPNTYHAGKGEIGIRTFYYIPYAADFKVGITDHVQLSGMATDNNSYDASIVVNLQDNEKRFNLTTFGIGGGLYGSGFSQEDASWFDSSIDDVYKYGPSYYIYAGWYFGIRFNEHISLSIPVRFLVLNGTYDYYVAYNNTTAPGRYMVEAVIEEADWSFDWRYFGMKVGINLPYSIHQDANAGGVVVIFIPGIESGIYFKW